RSPESAGVVIFTSPRVPRPGVPLRVLAISEQPLDATLALADPSGVELAGSAERHGGPPYWWYAEVASPAAGAHRAALRTASVSACAPVAIEPEPAPDKTRTWSGVW